MKAHLTPLCLVAGGLLLAAAVSGCTGRYESDFPVLVINRTANQIQALANGNALGEVAAGQTGAFRLSLPESNANVFVNGAAPTPQAEVTLTARDTRTGALSSEKSVVLTKGSPTSVAFSADDFPSTGPTVARFTFSPTNPTINLDVSFNGSASSVSNGMFVWDFGDGQTGTGVTTTHRYARNGTFTITLTVTSDTKATSTSSRTINVSATLPPATANFTFSPTMPAMNQDVSFTGNAQVPGGGFPGGPGGPGGGAPVQGATYTWDFGDGTSGTGTSAMHRYTRGGTYTVRLIVTSEAGLSATTTRQITVSTTLPAGSAGFVFSPTDPHVGDTVYFNASSSTATDATYAWDFGDGSSASGVTPTHRYSQERTYTVSLTVTNSRGQVATASKTITVAGT
ncbi:MAG: PKD domain-containing protein [Acidobacteria bacterium]|nr:PKD domain-containing protein [Acidobacteriota bacterium]